MCIIVEVGEYVEADEVVAVIETDKVNVDIRSPQAGVITKFFANEGDTVAVDSNFYEIDAERKAGASKPKTEEKKEEKP
jgi:2-oxoglutarate dehydrogenase E2 component (dihydrolipoamide succinyltransferase)